MLQKEKNSENNENIFSGWKIAKTLQKERELKLNMYWNCSPLLLAMHKGLCLVPEHISRHICEHHEYLINPQQQYQNKNCVNVCTEELPKDFKYPRAKTRK